MSVCVCVLNYILFGASEASHLNFHDNYDLENMNCQIWVKKMTENGSEMRKVTKKINKNVFPDDKWLASLAFKDCSLHLHF